MIIWDVNILTIWNMRTEGKTFLAPSGCYCQKSCRPEQLRYFCGTGDPQAGKVGPVSNTADNLVHKCTRKELQVVQFIQYFFFSLCSLRCGKVTSNLTRVAGNCGLKFFKRRAIFLSGSQVNLMNKCSDHGFQIWMEIISEIVSLKFSRVKHEVGVRNQKGTCIFRTEYKVQHKPF